MENSLRTLFLKQDLDILGPKQSIKFGSITELDLLKHFQGKVSLYELLLYFKADYGIIPTTVVGSWLEGFIKAPGYKEYMIERTSGVSNPEDIDFGQYDLVITHDPILFNYIDQLKKRFPKTVFSYILAEHSAWQLHELGFKYDVYLDHTNQSSDNVVRLPQALNMIFPRVPSSIRNMFAYPKTHIFLDYRTVGYFISNGSNNVKLEMSQVEEFFNQTRFSLPTIELSETSLQPFMFGREDNDGIEYYSKLSKSKYFVSIANRIGQAAFDAASAGALVIGCELSAMHKLICHPDMLCKEKITLQDLTKLINLLENDSSLYSRMLEHQEKMLKLYAIDKPKANLEAICKIKQS